jgi:hypothetical protein
LNLIAKKKETLLVKVWAWCGPMALTRRLAASAALTVLETAWRSCCAFPTRSSSEDLLLAREAFTLGSLQKESRPYTRQGGNLK